MILWAFGCSHTAGQSLGLNVDLISWIYDNTGYGTLDEYYKKEKINSKDKWNNIKIKWQKYTNGSYDCKLSYAGRLAHYLNFKLNNLSIPGSSLDYCFFKFEKYKHKINWKTDLVIFGVPSPYRYINMKSEPIQVNTHLNELNDLSDKKYFLKYTIHEKTLGLYWKTTLEFLKNNYPIKFIKIYNRYLSINGMEEYSKFKFSFEKSLFDFNCGSYPCGHLNEESHDKFAVYLKEKLQGN